MDITPEMTIVDISEIWHEKHYVPGDPSSEQLKKSMDNLVKRYLESKKKVKDG